MCVCLQVPETPSPILHKRPKNKVAESQLPSKKIRLEEDHVEQSKVSSSGSGEVSHDFVFVCVMHIMMCSQLQAPRSMSPTPHKGPREKDSDSQLPMKNVKNDESDLELCFNFFYRQSC